jgi:hypothetical protein
VKESPLIALLLPKDAPPTITYRHLAAPAASPMDPTAHFCYLPRVSQRSRPFEMLMAPGPSGTAAIRLPGRQPFPSLDERLVTPETREEIVRGRKIIAQPALDPHADRHFELDYILRGHVHPDYIGSTDLLTRADRGSDFATDTCVRRAGKDPVTGARYLEELAFEVVNEQPLSLVTEKAEDLIARGVRRVFAIFVKSREVDECNPKKRTFVRLDLSKSITDRCLVRPILVKALLDAAEADNSVARALDEKKNPVILAIRAESKIAGKAEGKIEGRAEGKIEGKIEALLRLVARVGIPLAEDDRARILACSDGAMLDRWFDNVLGAKSASDIFS